MWDSKSVKSLLKTSIITCTLKQLPSPLSRSSKEKKTKRKYSLLRYISTTIYYLMIFKTAQKAQMHQHKLFKRTRVSETLKKNFCSCVIQRALCYKNWPNVVNSYSCMDCIDKHFKYVTIDNHTLWFYSSNFPFFCPI